MSQTQIGENANNLDNVESYIQAGNYDQLAILVMQYYDRNFPKDSDFSKDSDEISSIKLIIKRM